MINGIINGANGNTKSIMNGTNGTNGTNSTNGTNGTNGTTNGTNGFASSNRTLLVLGAGPGIGRSVTTLFASHRYGKVVLIARRAEQLELEKETVERIHGVVKVGTYAVDLTNNKALCAALNDADAKYGKPETIFFNAARVMPSAFFEHKVEDIEYDLKVCVFASSPTGWVTPCSI